MDIASLLEVQVNEAPSSSSAVAPEEDHVVKEEPRNVRPSENVSEEEKHFRQLVFGNDIAKVRFRKLHCTSCDTHIGSAPSEAYNMQEHPVLKVLLCAACREFYGDGAFEQGDDATDMFCRWCANGGNLYCCSYCSNTFCQKCIRLNFDIEVRKQIEADEKWKCFACEPGPLYSHRAVCWALLLHVKTLTRILTADCTMTPKEVLSKMEQDDSPCCPGRRAKRKRRNTNSSSEDEFMASSAAGNTSKKKKKSLKRRRPTMSKPRSATNELTNGRYVTSTGSKIGPEEVANNDTDGDGNNNQHDDDYDNDDYDNDDYDNDDDKGRRHRNNDDDDDDDDITSLLNPEQTMIEDESVIIPSINHTSTRVLVSKSHLNINRQNILQRSTGSRGTRMMVPIRSLRKINSLPFGATPQLITRLPALSKRPTAAPMVSIPTRPVLISKSGLNNNQSFQSRPKNYSNIRIDRNDPKLQAKTTTPSVIDLESDSDDGNTQKSSSPQNHITRKSNSNSCHNRMTESENLSTQSESQDSTYPRLTIKNFNQNINNPLRVMDDILKKLRKKLKNEMVKFEKNAPLDGDNSDINSAKNKLKIININITKIVSELAAFNNTLVRQYKPWKDSCLNGKTLDDLTETIRLKKGDASHKIISLDMECECDSESDKDCDNEPDENIEEYLPIDYSNRLLEFKEKETVDRSCTAKVQTQDKAIQVYDNDYSVDYDMKIGYSLLMKADFDPEQNKEVFKPVIIEDPFFGKYEEQFIFYLQTLEEKCLDYRDEEKENASPKEKSLTAIIDSDLSIERINTKPINEKTIVDGTKSVDNDCQTKYNEMSNIDPLDNSRENKQLTALDSMTPRQDAAADENDALTSVGTKNNEITRLSANIDEENKDYNILLGQEIRNEETATAVEALIGNEGQKDSNVGENSKISDDDDECTILD